jgi:DNA-binding IclR family transcriptional regulator
MGAKKKINSVANAAEILKCLSGGIEKVSDISRKLDINKATVYKILVTLKSQGLATQDPVSRKYFLGPTIQSLAFNSYSVHQVLIQCAHQALEKISDISGETVGLQIRQDVRRLVLDEVMSSNEVLFYRGIGHSAPIYAGAAGKLLLSELDKNDLNKLLKVLDLIPVGPKSISDKVILIEELDKIKKNGYATSISETFDGAAAIAVPVKEYICPIALAVIGPVSRFEDKMTSMLKMLYKSSEEISRKLKIYMNAEDH